MKQEKIQWLGALAPQATAQVKDSAREQKKQALLAKLVGDMEAQRAKLIENGKIKVTDAKGKKQDVVNYKVRDQTTEFDIDEMRDGFALGRVITDDMTIEEQNEAREDTADMQAHLETERLVNLMVKQLEAEQEETDELDEHGKKKKKPLFDKKDLIDEVYQPLVRQGLMGETFVPNEFSQTKEMLDATFEEYGKRLQEENQKSFFAENKDLIFTSITSTIGGVGSGATFGQVSQGAQNSNWGTQSWDNNLLKQGTASEVSTIAGYVGWGFQGVTSGFDAKEDFFSGEGKDPAGRESLAPHIAQGIVSGLAAQLGSALSEAGLGVAASSAFGSMVKVAVIAKTLGGETLTAGNVTTVRDLLGAAYTEVLTAIDPGDDPATTRSLRTAGGLMSTEYKAKVAVDKIVAALTASDTKKLDAGGAINLFVQVGQGAVAKGKSELDPILGDPAKKKKVLKKINDKISEDFLKAQEDNERRAAQELEELKNVGDLKLEASRLDKKIAELQRYQKLLKWGANLLGLGFSIASQVIAPMAIGGAAVALAQNLIQAGMRTRDALTFIDSRKGMLNAASAYSSAVANFVSNSEWQAAHYYANAAFQLATMIGAILQCTGILAAAGAAVSATAGSAAALEAVLYSAKKRMDLETAWKQYKLALSRPENRKLGLIALRENPTLAKYAVAWGAVIKKDPLVSDFMSRCGLDAETLKDEKTTSKVVKYLETRMPDDNVVVGRKFPSADFAPSPVVLTAECWASAKSRGASKAHLKPQDTRSLDSALERFGQAAAALPSKLEAMNHQVADATPPDANIPAVRAKVTECNKQIVVCEEAIAACKTLLATAKKGFESYKPELLDDEGKNIGPHTKMMAVVGDFLSLADESDDTLDKQAAHVKTQKDLVATWTQP